MALFFVNILTLVLSVSSFASEDLSDPVVLDRKIKAFDEFEVQSKAINKLRESDLDDLLQRRKDEAKKREILQEEYLAEKQKAKKIKPEDSTDYEEYLLKKWDWREKQEKAAEVEFNQKKNLRPGKKARDFELREYALEDTEKNRIPFNRRNIFGGKPGSGKSGGFSGGFGGGGGGGGAPPFIPPPPIEDVPDFDNDIPPPPPPPPPPPMGGGDFDMGEPVPIPPPPPME